MVVVFGGWFYYSIIGAPHSVPATPTSSVSSTSTKQTTSSASSAPDYTKLMANLPKNQMIQDLPDGKSLYFQTFSFSSGQRVWEKSFVIEKGTMKEGVVSNPEVTLTLHSKYVNQITSSNLCDVLRTANINKDLGFESSLDLSLIHI